MPWSAAALLTSLSSTPLLPFVPKAEIEGDMGDSHVGLQARLMSQALRKLTGIISKSRTATVFINQIREKWVSCSEIRKQRRVAVP